DDVAGTCGGPTNDVVRCPVGELHADHTIWQSCYPPRISADIVALNNVSHGRCADDHHSGLLIARNHIAVRSSEPANGVVGDRARGTPNLYPLVLVAERRVTGSVGSNVIPGDNTAARAD